VLQDVDDSVRSLLEAVVTRNGGRTRVVFDAPTPAWAAGQKDPVINLFLFDVREDRDGRGGDEVDVRDSHGHVIGRRPPTRKYQLSYLASAWAKDAEEEHRMLGSIVATVPDIAAIPDEHLKGRLGEQGLAVNIDVAVPVSGAQTWDLWSALGTPPRTALEIVVTAPVLPELRTDLAPPAEKLDLGVHKEAPGKVGARREPEPEQGSEPTPPAEPAAKGRPAARRARGKSETADETPPLAPARPGKRWTTFKVREHTPADAGD
jgi:hypothetical protein